MTLDNIALTFLCNLVDFNITTWGQLSCLRKLKTIAHLITERLGSPFEDINRQKHWSSFYQVGPIMISRMEGSPILMPNQLFHHLTTQMSYMWQLISFCQCSCRITTDDWLLIKILLILIQPYQVRTRSARLESSPWSSLSEEKGFFCL